MPSIQRSGHQAKLVMALAIFVLVLVAGSVMPAYPARQGSSVTTGGNNHVLNTDHTTLVQGGMPSSANVQPDTPSSSNVLLKNQFVGFLPVRRDSFSSVGDDRANYNLGFFSSGCGAFNGICGNLTYHNGSVMHNPKDFLIFWLPPGYSFDNSTIDPTAASPSDSFYEQMIIQYFTDICQPNAFYSIIQQYPDSSGPIGSCSLGGSWIDTSNYPSGRGFQYDPLTYTDITNEVSAALASNTSWSSDNGNNEFFVFTGYGVCSASIGCPGDYYCAYHSSFTSSTGSQIVFANMPDLGNLYACLLGASPNQDVFADSEINLASHEQFEAFTDPNGRGWFYKDGAHEISDECYLVFDSAGTTLQVGADEYRIQDEWSNNANGCTSQETLKAGLTTLSYTGATSADYGDTVTLSAKLTDSVTALGISGKTIVFFFNGIQIGSASTDSTGIAILQYNVAQNPGSMSVHATWPGDSQTMPSDTGLITFTLNKENTTVTYTGNTILSTTSNGLTLQALITVDGGTELYSPFGGTLTNSVVNFTVYTTTLTPTRLGSILVPISVVSGLAGTASISLSCKAGSGSPPNLMTCGGMTLQEGAYDVQVEIDPTNAYFTSSISHGTFSVYVPTVQFVTGGGWVADPSSTNPKNRADFVFTVRYDKNGQVQGQSVYIYRAPCVSPAPTNDLCDIMIKSNAWIGLGFYKQTTGGVTQWCANFQSKSNVQETDTATGVAYSVQENNQMTVYACQGDSKSSPAGTLSLKDLSQTGTIFHATQDYPTGVALAGGSVVVHNNKLTPTTSLSPSTCSAGTMIMVSGVGFAPPTNIKITIGSIVLATTTTDSTGSFSTTFTAPLTAGAYTVTVSDGTNATWATLRVT